MSGSRIVLLTSDDDIRASTTVDEVAAYFKGIQREVESYFQVHDPKVGHSISVHLELEADGKAGIKIVATPEMDTESLNALHGKLTAVPAARTSGPIRLEVIFTIRGGPGI